MMKAGSTTLITPRLQILTEDQKETLFLSALGCWRAQGKGGQRRGAGVAQRSRCACQPARRVHIPSYLVEDALASAPRSIALYSRDGEPAALLEDGRVYFSSQVDSTYFFDPFNRTRRLSIREDAGWEPCFAMRCQH